MQEVEDCKQVARANVLIDLTRRLPPDAAIKSNAAIDLTRDSTFINLAVDEKESRKRRWSDHSHDKKKAKVARNKPCPVDCSICLETVEAFQGYRLVACHHSFCRPCLHGYIQSKLASKEVQQLTCPDTSCRNPLDTVDVRACTLELGDFTSWQSFQEVATESFLDTAASSKGTSIRRCPTNHCNFTFQYDAANNQVQQQGQLFI